MGESTSGQADSATRPLSLGWHSYRLGVSNLKSSLDFYQQLGFTVAGGSTEAGWLALNNAGTDLSLQRQSRPANRLGFHGADIHVLAQEHRRRGFDLIGFADYDPAARPEQWHIDDKGAALPLAGSATYTLLDPDGNELGFDTTPLERARLAAGQRSRWPGFDGSLQAGQRALGWLHVCLNVGDIQASFDFYNRLGLQCFVDQRPQGWAILGSNDPGYFRVAIFQGHIRCNLLNFRGEDISALAAGLHEAGFSFESGPQLEQDGSQSFELRDPDDNVIYFNTFPGETP